MIRLRLHGKQPPLGLTAFARGAHAKAIRAKSLADQAKAAEAEALVAAAEAEARAQAAETACQQANELAERASQWAAAEARKTSQVDKDRWSSFAAPISMTGPDSPMAHCRAAPRTAAAGAPLGAPKRRSSCRASCGLLDPAEAIQKTL